MHKLKDKRFFKTDNKKYDPTIYYLQKARLSYNGMGRLKFKERKKIHYVNTRQKKAWLALLLLEKVDFRAKKIIRDKEEHYIMIKDQFTKKT